MVISRGMVWTIVITAALSLAASACLAADSGIAVGTVDVTKVYSEAPRVKQLRETLDKHTLDLSQKLEVRGQNLMLTEEQIKDLIELKMKVNPTEADKAKIKQYTDLERANDDELKKLQATTPPDEKQKARLTELTDLQKKAKTTGEQMEKDYNTQLQNEARDLEAKAASEIEQVIKKIAEEKKFAFVFARDAVFYGGTDITSQVIDKLERKSE
jgi:Skp family chaperone for outer membrane proteins